MNVPINLTPAQVMLVLEVLEELTTSLWCKYGDAILDLERPWDPLCQEPIQRPPPPSLESIEGGIPF